MKLIIETFVTIIFLTMAVFLATQIIGSQITINGANDFHVNVVQEIEESNFSESVIEACKAEAEELGYTLSVAIDSTSMYQCASCNNIWEEDQEVCPLCGSEYTYINYTSHKGEVVLDYTVELAVLGVCQEGRLEANIR
ncbi:MAG: hypothetical protein R3Y40_04110 [Eubacteriales bacterium]